MVWLC